MADQVLSNQKTIIANQSTIVKNQKAILANQSTITKNQKAILANQGVIKKNQSALNEILKNQKLILAALSLKHRNKLLNLAGARFRFLHSLNPPQDCIAVRAIQSFEERLRSRIRTESSLKIVWHSGLTWRIVSSFPSAILLSALHRGQPRRCHFSARNQRRCLVTIDL